MRKKYTRTPNRQVPTIIGIDIQQTLNNTIYDFFNPKDNSKYDVLIRRFGLDGKKPLTLEEIGILRGGISRERIRQLEKAGLEQLRTLFETGVSKEALLEVNILSKLQNYRLSLNSLAPAAKETLVIDHLEQFFNTKDFNINLLALLLNVFGFHSIRLSDESLVWIFAPVETERLEQVISKVSRYLKEHSEAHSWQDILLTMSKQSRSAKYKPEEIKLALSLAPDIEKLEDDSFQIRFEYLSATEDRVYRLMCKSDNIDPVDVEDIVRLHNREVLKYGLEPNSSSYISGSLSNDSRFQNIGKSGKWVLAKWGYLPENLLTIPDLIERTLKHAGDALPFEEIHEAVSVFRKVDRNHIRSELGNHPKRFVKLNDGRFGLRKLSKAASVVIPIKRQKVGLTKVKIALMVEQVFQQQNTRQIKLADLHKELCKLMTDYKSQNIWSMLTKPNPVITVMGQRRGQVATFNADFRKQFSALDLASNGEKGIFIKRAIRDLLLKNKRMSLKDLREEVALYCYTNPHNVFSHVKAMDDIQQEKDNKGIIYCNLILDVSSEYTGLLKKIQTPDIQSDVARGLSCINIDDVDLGLFILGRAFDVMSKLYFIQLSKLGKISTNKGIVSEVDASKYDLSTRIDLFISNSILKDSQPLHFLRKERNDPAHNIASFERRREMMTNASTYAKWYIEYIILFEEGSNNK